MCFTLADVRCPNCEIAMQPLYEWLYSSNETTLKDHGYERYSAQKTISRAVASDQKGFPYSLIEWPKWIARIPIEKNKPLSDIVKDNVWITSYSYVLYKGHIEKPIF